ncbi:MAG: hypothetical protein EOO77_06610 [Oxalobacteraceae bacterium]|nr:MAG: hypothetical protein EOO77_06610 [Oxalobacteraceae bacterium]
MLPSYLMSFHDSDFAVSADRLIRQHGNGARQTVIDEIVRAIRAHDMDAAKRWDQIGQEIDRKLAAFSATDAMV